MAGIVFREPGVVTIPDGGRVAVNRPCVVLCQDRRPDGHAPERRQPDQRRAATIHVEYANRCLCFETAGRT